MAKLNLHGSSPFGKHSTYLRHFQRLHSQSVFHQVGLVFCALYLTTNIVADQITTNSLDITKDQQKSQTLLHVTVRALVILLCLATAVVRNACSLHAISSKTVVEYLRKPCLLDFKYTDRMPEEVPAWQRPVVFFLLAAAASEYVGTATDKSRMQGKPADHSSCGCLDVFKGGEDNVETSEKVQPLELAPLAKQLYDTVPCLPQGLGFLFVVFNQLNVRNSWFPAAKIISAFQAEQNLRSHQRGGTQSRAHGRRQSNIAKSSKEGSNTKELSTSSGRRQKKVFSITQSQEMDEPNAESSAQEQHARSSNQGITNLQNQDLTSVAPVKFKRRKIRQTSSQNSRYSGHGKVSVSSQSSSQGNSKPSQSTAKTQQVRMAVGWSNGPSLGWKGRLCVWAHSEAYNRWIWMLNCFMALQVIFCSPSLGGALMIGFEGYVNPASAADFVSSMILLGVALPLIFNLPCKLVLGLWFSMIVCFSAFAAASSHLSSIFLRFMLLVNIGLFTGLSFTAQAMRRKFEREKYVLHRKTQNSISISMMRYLFHELRNPLSSALSSLEAASKSNSPHALVSMSENGLENQNSTDLHDSETVLSVIKNQHLQQQRDEALETASLSLRMMNDILDSSLDMQAFSEGRLSISPSEFNIGKLAKDCYQVMNPFARRHDCSITLCMGSATSQLLEFQGPYDISSANNSSLDLDLLETIGDVKKLVQVLNNLLSNACKYGQGEEVTLGVNVLGLSELPACVRPTDSQAESIKIIARQHAEMHDFPTQQSSGSAKSPQVVMFVVRDRGDGLNEEHKKKAFTPFHRLETHQAIKGTGLGLSICKVIVELHDGAIGILSEKEKGSAFVFWIPLLPSKPAVVNSKDLNRSISSEIITSSTALASTVPANQMDHATAGRLANESHHHQGHCPSAPVEIAPDLTNVSDRSIRSNSVEIPPSPTSNHLLSAKSNHESSARQQSGSSNNRHGENSSHEDQPSGSSSNQQIHSLSAWLPPIVPVLKSKDSSEIETQISGQQVTSSTANSHRVLLVDDDVFARKSAKNIVCSKLGLPSSDVFIASDGCKAIEALLKIGVTESVGNEEGVADKWVSLAADLDNKNFDQDRLACLEASKVSTIVVDYEMPNMGGVDFIKCIRRWERRPGIHVPAVRIVGLTGHAANSSEVEDMYSAGADIVFVKPLTVEKLEKAILGSSISGKHEK